MKKVIAYLGTNRGDGRKKDLNRLRELLSRLGNPHKKMSYIHITGSNGKGSTAAIFQSVLREAGLTVGFFSSPHLEFINERIRIDDEYIRDKDLIRLVNYIEPFVIELETERQERFYAFELLTVVSFLYFQEQNPDLVILEVGIGGRLDATNVIEQSEVALITSIGIDHRSTLGDTKEAIIKEKVQILKDNGQMVVGPVSPKLQKIARQWAENVNGEIVFIDPNDIKSVEQDQDYQIFDYKSYEKIKLSFRGRHQIENAVIVIEGVELLVEKGYPISRDALYQGLRKAYWPGRFEKILDQPLFYIDGAHNLASVDRLVETLTNLYPREKFHFIVGMMKDKDYEEMLEKVYPLAKEIILISPDPNRGFNPSEVAHLIKSKGIKVNSMNNIEELLIYIQTNIPQDEIIVQFGSLYLVGALKEEEEKIQAIQRKSLKF